MSMDVLGLHLEWDAVAEVRELVRRRGMLHSYPASQRCMVRAYTGQLRGELRGSCGGPAALGQYGRLEVAPFGFLTG